MSRSGIASPDIALRHDGSYLNIYLACIYNVSHEKREWRARCARFAICPSQPADPDPMIGTRARWEEKRATGAETRRLSLSDIAKITYISI